MPVNDFTRHPLSWQPDSARLTRPRYLALAGLLESDIAEGRLPPGTRLPPQRELADWLDLDFTTVTRAYGLCRERNLTYGVTGRGTFVAPLPGSESDEPASAVDLGAVQFFAGLGSDAIVAAAREVLGRDYVTRLFSYTDRDGAARHRAAGAAWLNRFGVPVKAENLAVFPGAQNALATILLAVFRSGDALAVDAFTYSNLIGVAKLAHVKLVPVEGDADGMAPAALDEAAARHRLRGVFLMPTCANPTAITLPQKRRTELAAVISKRDLLVIEDDAAAAPSQNETFFAALPERTFYLAGSTRILAAGLRASLLASPSAYRKGILSALHQLTIKTSALDSEIMSELVLSGRAEDILARKVENAGRMNAVFASVFPRERRRAKDAAFFRTVALPETQTDNGPEVERELVARGVKVCHSDRFAAGNRPHRKFLRLSLSSTESESELRRGLLIVREALPELRCQRSKA